MQMVHSLNWWIRGYNKSYQFSQHFFPCGFVLIRSKLIGDFFFSIFKIRLFSITEACNFFVQTLVVLCRLLTFRKKIYPSMHNLRQGNLRNFIMVIVYKTCVAQNLIFVIVSSTELLQFLGKKKCTENFSPASGNTLNVLVEGVIAIYMDS